MRNQKPFEWNGVTYRSHAAAALILGLTPAGIGYRARMGWACDDDIPERVRGVPVVFKRVYVDIRKK